MAYALKPSRKNLSGCCCVTTLTSAAATALAFSHALVLRHWIVLEDFALEDPDLDAVCAERGESRCHAVIDVSAQRVQRHTTFAVPLHARDFRAAQTAR